MNAESVVKALEAGASVADICGVGPGQLEALYALGHDLYTRGRAEDAGDVFTLLTMYDATEPRFWFARGSSALERRALPEAIGAFGFAALLNVNDAWALVHLGECLLLQEEIPLAREALGRAIERAADCADGAALARAKGFLRYLEVRHG